MKTTLKYMCLTLAASSALSTSAELIVYKGTEKDAYIGNGYQHQVNSKVFLILDHNTAEVRIILYTTINGNKLHTSATISDLHFVEVTDAKGKVTSGLSYVFDQCDMDSGRTSEGVFLEGANASLKVGSNSVVSFPKSMQYSGRGYSTTYSEFDNRSLTVTFDSSNTLQANGNGETIDGCQSRLINALENQGYAATVSSAAKAALQSTSVGTAQASFSRSAAPLR